MKHILQVSALFITVFFYSQNSSGKCIDYLKYNFLHSTSWGYIPDWDSTYTLNLNPGDTLKISGWATDIIGGPCGTYWVDFYLDGNGIGGGLGPHSILINSPGNYSAHIGHMFFFKVSTQVGISENSSEVHFNIFPNPASEKINLQFFKEAYHNITISNAFGQTIFQTVNNSLDFNFDMAELPKGIYFVQVKEEHKNSATRKIIKM